MFVRSIDFLGTDLLDNNEPGGEGPAVLAQNDSWDALQRPRLVSANMVPRAWRAEDASPMEGLAFRAVTGNSAQQEAAPGREALGDVGIAPTAVFHVDATASRRRHPYQRRRDNHDWTERSVHNSGYAGRALFSTEYLPAILAAKKDSIMSGPSSSLHQRLFKVAFTSMERTNGPSADTEGPYSMRAPKTEPSSPLAMHADKGPADLQVRVSSPASDPSSTQNAQPSPKARLRGVLSIHSSFKGERKADASRKMAELVSPGRGGLPASGPNQCKSGHPGIKLRVGDSLAPCVQLKENSSPHTGQGFFITAINTHDHDLNNTRALAMDDNAEEGLQSNIEAIRHVYMQIKDNVPHDAQLGISRHIQPSPMQPRRCRAKHEDVVRERIQAIQRNVSSGMVKRNDDRLVDMPSKVLTTKNNYGLEDAVLPSLWPLSEPHPVAFTHSGSPQVSSASRTIRSGHREIPHQTSQGGIQLHRDTAQTVQNQLDPGYYYEGTANTGRETRASATNKLTEELRRTIERNVNGITSVLTSMLRNPQPGGQTSEPAADSDAAYSRNNVVAPETRHEGQAIEETQNVTGSSIYNVYRTRPLLRERAKSPLRAMAQPPALQHPHEAPVLLDYYFGRQTKHLVDLRIGTHDGKLSERAMRSTPPRRQPGRIYYTTAYGTDLPGQHPETYVHTTPVYRVPRNDHTRSPHDLLELTASADDEASDQQTGIQVDNDHSRESINLTPILALKHPEQECALELLRSVESFDELVEDKKKVSESGLGTKKTDACIVNTGTTNNAPSSDTDIVSKVSSSTLIKNESEDSPSNGSAM